MEKRARPRVASTAAVVAGGLAGAAPVHRAVLLGAEQVRVGEVPGADLRQHLAARGDRLRLERLGGRAAKISEGTSPRADPRATRGSPPRWCPPRPRRRTALRGTGAGLEAVVRVAHRELHRADLESLAARSLGPDGPVARPERRAVGHVQLQPDRRRGPDLLGERGARAPAPEQLGLPRRGLGVRRARARAAPAPSGCRGSSRRCRTPGRAARGAPGSRGPPRSPRSAAMPSLSAQASSVTWTRKRRSAGVPSSQRTTSGVPPGASTTFSGLALEEQAHPAAGHEGHLAPVLHQAHRDGGLARPDVEPTSGGRRWDVERRRTRIGRLGSGDGHETVTTGAGGGRRTGRGAAHPVRARARSHAHPTPVPLGRVTSGKRRHPDSNRGMRVLQTLALPLGDGAGAPGFVVHPRCTGQGMAISGGRWQSDDMAKLRALLVGATGIAGQQFVSALRDHPWFEIGAIAASPRNVGKRYDEAVAGGWFLAEPIPAEIAAMRLLDPGRAAPRAWTWSSRAVESDVARELEPRLAAELPVISAASTFRMEPDVPLLIPPVNAGARGPGLGAARRAAGGARWLPIPNCTDDRARGGARAAGRAVRRALGGDDLAPGGVRRRPLTGRGRARHPRQRRPLHPQGGGEGRGGDPEDPRSLGCRAPRPSSRWRSRSPPPAPGSPSRTATPRRSRWGSAARPAWRR